MATKATNRSSIIEGIEWNEVTEKLRTRKVLGFFTVNSWVTVSERSVGNDIHIETDREIRHVYLNGELIR